MNATYIIDTAAWPCSLVHSTFLFLYANPHYRQLAGFDEILKRYKRARSHEYIMFYLFVQNPQCRRAQSCSFQHQSHTVK